jgi:hypothetical protein
MKAFEIGPAPALHPGLQLLIDRGILARVQANDAAAFEQEVFGAVSRGEVTPSQASTMGQMLGVRAA